MFATRTRAWCALRPLLATLVLGSSAPSLAQVTWFVDGTNGLPSPLGTGMSWGTAFQDLQDALAVAQSGDEIHVAVGTYRPAGPNGNRSSTFQMLDGVAVRGGFTNGAAVPDPALFEQTVLDGDLNGNDLPGFGNNAENVYHVVNGTTSIADPGLLEGFRIRGGNANFGGVTNGTRGGGLLATGGAQEIRSCTFEENRADNDAGGALLLSFSGLFADCEFRDNSTIGPGGAVNMSGGPVFERCSFRNNSASFGGAVSTAVSTCFEACVFESNSATNAGGAVDSGGGSPSFVNCTFVLNQAPIGGALRLAGDATFANSLFIGNEATTGDGGAAALFGSISPEFKNCTLHANRALSGAGGGLALTATTSVPIVDNSILWDNQDSGVSAQIAQISVLAGGSVFASFTCLQGWTAAGPIGGSGMSALDPQFVDPVGPDAQAGTGDEDLTLMSGSPCVDAGVLGKLPLDDKDLDGDGVMLELLPLDLQGLPRVVGGSVDAGCFEQQAPVSVDCNGNGVDDTVDIAMGTSNDFNGNGVPDECETLRVDVPTISLSAGGTQTLTLDAGPSKAGFAYLVLGSITGTAPTPFGDVVLPLTQDFYFLFTLLNPNSSLLANSLNTLDGAGQATASLLIPAGLSVPGITSAFHAYALVGSPFASNAVSVQFVP